MYGYNGKILRINLSTRSFTVDTPSEDYYRTCIGGRGIIIHTLLSEIPAGVDPLGPGNKLVFALGPLTGYLLPGSGRNSIGAKSPVTGGFGESEAGGYWGAELKRAGYDAIIVEGAAPEPVYLFVDNGKVEIRDASRLWGMEIADADEAIRQELGSDRIRTALIGPGGEKLILYASIANDITHFAGRTGLGAVMGSKKLKAIAVKGDQPPAAADPEKIRELARWMGKHFKEKAANHNRYGTGATMEAYEASGNLPVLNFRGGRFPGVEKITPLRLFDKGYVKKRETCYACPIRCKRAVSLQEPWTVDIRYGGPEYETLGALGSNCGVDNIEALMKANEICARHGIDTISTGVSISFAMECYEQGILTKEDTGGLDLRFGNAGALIEMVERIAARRGLGDLLAQGTKKAAEIIGRGSSDFAIHCKGVELPMHEPRFKQGMGLHYSVNAAGADHCSGIMDDQLIKNIAKGQGLNQDGTLTAAEMSPRKARLLYDSGRWRHIGNYVGMCLFVPWSSEQISAAFQAVTGWPMGVKELEKAVERGMALARIFNLREGFGLKDDTLPRRFFGSPAEGPLKDTAIDPGELAAAQQAYFAMLGWDASGIPTPEKLRELGLEWAVAFLKDFRGRRP
jgi:aldehyde:ferredoxin oxidoreductase